MTNAFLVIVLLLLVIHVTPANQKMVPHFKETSPTNTTKEGTESNREGIHIFTTKFESVEIPFIVCCWILLVSVSKLIFHKIKWLSKSIPESCLLILLGLPIGFILEEAGLSPVHIYLSSSVFFSYLLPPIIFDAGYNMNNICFFNNIGTILLYAVLGTILNTFLVGASMFGVASTTTLPHISLLKSLLFGALISAVDPVAVLAVFEEVQVNEVLYMLVFGESVLNDAASVVLYHTFQNLPDQVDGKQVGLAILSFFVVSLLGTVIGVVYGLVASFCTKYTHHTRVLEPAFVFLMAYMAYLTAEVFEFSGIVSILFCGVVMKPYSDANISKKSHITIKYFLRLLSSSCEAVIFMFLGIALVHYSHNFDIVFIAWCILFITLYRAVGVFLLTWLANKFGRLEKVSKTEQLIMVYGGLRGAVAFCLALILEENNPEETELKRLLVTTTLAVIIFTCFVQGATMKKLVEKLGVKKAEKRDVAMSEHLNNKVMRLTVSGIESIIGVHGHGHWRNMIQLLNRKILRPLLCRNPEMILDDELFREERKKSKAVPVVLCNLRNFGSTLSFRAHSDSFTDLPQTIVNTYSNSGFEDSCVECTSFDSNEDQSVGIHGVNLKVPNGVHK